jgi:aminoglycoside 3-N-acetyltransferase
MVRDDAASKPTSALRKALKARWKSARVAWVRRFRAYEPDALRAALRRLGVDEGDTLLVHSGFSDTNGFRGSIGTLIDTFAAAVGARGHVLMVSLPYRDSTFAYLQRLQRFDVRRTPSMMGMVSEMFRRREGVLRSLHPTHPVLASGPRAAWFVQGHEDCPYPCGPGTPFDKLVQSDAKVLFFDVPFATYTFFHYLEHRVHEARAMPFALYTAQPVEVRVVDALGKPGCVRTHVFDPAIIARRRFGLFEQALRERGAIRGEQLGATSLEVVRVRDTIDCVDAMLESGRYFYDMEGAPAAAESVRPTAPL